MCVDLERWGELDALREQAERELELADREVRTLIETAVPEPEVAA